MKHILSLSRTVALVAPFLWFVSVLHGDTVPPPPAAVLTPKPAPTPRLNGPAVFGVRPGSPFLFAIPATGTRPMAFAADGLPAGLRLDPSSGRITGVLSQRGEYRVTLRARNALGASARPFRIVVGDDIALTPPMGWNSWNCWGEQRRCRQGAAFRPRARRLRP